MHGPEPLHLDLCPRENVGICVSQGIGVRLT